MGAIGHESIERLSIVSDMNSDHVVVLVVAVVSFSDAEWWQKVVPRRISVNSQVAMQGIEGRES